MSKIEYDKIIATLAIFGVIAFTTLMRTQNNAQQNKYQLNIRQTVTISNTSPYEAKEYQMKTIISNSSYNKEIISNLTVGNVIMRPAEYVIASNVEFTDLIANTYAVQTYILLNNETKLLNTEQITIIDTDKSISLISTI